MSTTEALQPPAASIIGSSMAGSAISVPARQRTASPAVYLPSKACSPARLIPIGFSTCSMT